MKQKYVDIKLIQYSGHVTAHCYATRELNMSMLSHVNHVSCDILGAIIVNYVSPHHEYVN